MGSGKHSPLAALDALPPPPPTNHPYCCCCCAGSGGAGAHRGGDGVVRELEFLRPLTASILSERRAVPPFGLLGGGEAARGVNLWLRRDGQVVSLGGKATVQVEGGDRLRILTPGGGGYGAPPGEQQRGVGEAAAPLPRATAEFSAPVRDSGSVHQWTRDAESV